MGNRRRNRGKSHQTQNPPRRDRARPALAWLEGTQAVPEDDLSRMRVIPPADTDTRTDTDAGTRAIPPEDDEDLRSVFGYDASRGNAVKHGMRGKVVFPEEIASRIDDRTRDYTAELKPQTGLERWLVFEMARTSVQVEVCANLRLLDQRRVLDRAAGPCWEVDAKGRAQRLAAKLPSDPARVAWALECTKQGTLLLIDHWKCLGDAIASNSGLDDGQRALAFDLLGVPQVLRNGSRQVPPGSDAPALAALVARETARHQENLDTVLNDRDRSEQAWVMMNVVRHPDATTRQLRSDEARAYKRMVWATETLKLIRKGVNAATIIDPATRSPLDPNADAPPRAGRGATAKAKAAPAGPPPPSPPPPTEPESSSSSSTSPSPPTPTLPLNLPSYPDGCPEEMKESLMVFAETFHQLRAAVRAAEAEAAAPVAAEPSPSV
jgi:hypothetical protein